MPVTKRKVVVSKRTAFWPCGSCRTNCLSDSIFCDSCNHWYHIKCENLSISDFRSFQNDSFTYTCEECFSKDIGLTYNYDSGLARLVQWSSSRGVQSLGFAAKREQQHLPPFLHYGKQNIPVDFVEIDCNAQRILSKCNLKSHGVPAQTTGDGNCLFNAVSISLTGDEMFATELRLRTAIEMILNEKTYKSHPDFNDLLKHSPDYRESIESCCTQNAFSSIWTIMALSNVIGKPVQSLYPKMNEGIDTASVTLTKLFWGPNIDPKINDKVTILWTRMGPVPRRTWTANHFVPVLADNNHDELNFNLTFEPNSQSTPNAKSKRKAEFKNENSISPKQRKTDFVVSDTDGAEYRVINTNPDQIPLGANIRYIQVEEMSKVENSSNVSMPTDLNSIDLSRSVTQIECASDDGKSVSTNTTEGETFDHCATDNVFPAPKNVKKLTRLHSSEEAFKMILDRSVLINLLIN